MELLLALLERGGAVATRLGLIAGSLGLSRLRDLPDDRHAHSEASAQARSRSGLARHILTARKIGYRLEMRSRSKV
jgi:hypothetical protein